MRLSRHRLQGAWPVHTRFSSPRKAKSRIQYRLFSILLNPPVRHHDQQVLWALRG